MMESIATLNSDQGTGMYWK